MNSGDKAGRAKVQKGKKGKSIGKEPTTYQMGNGLITLSSLVGSLFAREFFIICSTGIQT